MSSSILGCEGSASLSVFLAWSGGLVSDRVFLLPLSVNTEKPILRSESSVTGGSTFESLLPLDVGTRRLTSVVELSSCFTLCYFSDFMLVPRRSPLADRLDCCRV